MNIKTLIASVAIAAASITGAYASDFQTIVASSFKLYEGDRGICSTTLVKADATGAFFLTAAHCIEDENVILNIRLQKLDPKDLKTVQSEEVYYVKPVKLIKGKDVALLKTIDPTASFLQKPVDIATPDEAASLTIGDQVTLVGFPQANIKAVTLGQYAGMSSQIFKDLDSIPVIQSAVPLAPGSSGGALYAKFGDEYKIIGTTTGGDQRNTMEVFASTQSVNDVLVGFVTKSNWKPTSLQTDQR